MKKCCQATKEELKEYKRKCWWSTCNKTSHFGIHGWWWCFKHWRMDYKYGSCVGLWRAFKWTKLK